MADTVKKIKKLLFILLLFLYIFLFGSPVSNDYQFVSIWYRNAEQEIMYPMTNSEGLISFQGSDYFGYMTTDGLFSFLDRNDRLVALDDECFLLTQGPQQYEVLKNDGEFFYSVRHYGEPVLHKGSILFIDHKQTQVKSISKAEKEQWSKLFLEPITFMAPGTGKLVIGTLNGKIVLIDAMGNELFTYQEPEQSVFYGGSLTEDKTIFAVISADSTDRGRVHLFKRNYEDEYYFYPPVTYELPIAPLTPVQIDWADNDELLIVSAKEHLLLIDVDTWNVNHVMMKTDIINSLFYHNNNTLHIITDDDVYSVYTRAGKKIYRYRLPGTPTFLKEKGDSFFIGVDNSVLKLGSEYL